MHTFGFPVEIDKIVSLCKQYSILVVEDAAESLGSYYKGKHTGTFGAFGTLSFNGNKVITAGGGGMILTNDEELARKAKHVTTTAKVPHKWEFVHDQIGFNYRMPNINAALGCAQLENLDDFLESKKKLSNSYTTFFSRYNQVNYLGELKDSSSNFWLNALVLPSKKDRDIFLRETNENGVMTRPIWKLMNHLEMFKDFQTENIDNALWLEERVVNIPSTPII